MPTSKYRPSPRVSLSNGDVLEFSDDGDVCVVTRADSRIARIIRTHGERTGQLWFNVTRYPTDERRPFDGFSMALKWAQGRIG